MMHQTETLTLSTEQTKVRSEKYGQT